ncbi:MAG: hypothetical protein IJH39_01835 [Clostridia bacterium]|nr:hypothetical protein [Clostridia bacterium]
MNKTIIKELNPYESFDINSVIHCNGVIYSDYTYRFSSSEQSNIKLSYRKITAEILSPKIIKNKNISNIIFPLNMVVGQVPIETGNFLYNRSELVEQIIIYAKKLFNIIRDTNVIKMYVNRLNDSLLPPLKNLYDNIEFEKLNIIIDFFKEFGFPFNNINNEKTSYSGVSYDLIEGKIIPSLLIIYIVNTIYEHITFLETANLFNENLDTVTNIIYELFEYEKLFNTNTKEIKIDLNVDLTKINYDNFKLKLDYQLFDYKINLIEIINLFSNKFLAPKKHTFYSYDEDKNVSILKSDNLLDLAWAICSNKILTEFKLGKKKICRKCHLEFIAKTDDVYCNKCKTTISNSEKQGVTKNNKKRYILELLEYENYIFDDNDINIKIQEYKELKVSGKIDNIDGHDYKIKTELKPLKSKIQNEIHLNKYRLK